MARFTRRQFLRAAAVGGTAGGLAVLAADPSPPAAKSSDDFVTADTQSAIDKGLDYLAGSQAADGSFTDRNTSNVGITAIAGLALLSGGHHPGRGKYGKHVGRAADYVIARGRANTISGYLTSGGGQGDMTMAMYQHGFASLFLSEVHGTFPDAERRTKARDMLEKAVALIVKSQNNAGGWRYDPKPQNDDVSVTVAELMALRAAKNAGVYIDKSVVDKAVKYIRGCRQTDDGFAYIKGQTGSAFPRTAAAVVGLYSAGIYEGVEITGGLDYLSRFRPRGAKLGGADIRAEHYFYGHYYAALAMWTAGGTFWADWFPAIRNELLIRRDGQNVWSDFFGTAYATAMACIILQLPNNYLPIMQK